MKQNSCTVSGVASEFESARALLSGFVPQSLRNTTLV
jgi:hypothetical protein